MNKKSIINVVKLNVIIFVNNVLQQIRIYLNLYYKILIISILNLILTSANAYAASSAQADVLKFTGSHNQASVISLSTDPFSNQVDYVNASFDSNYGMVVQVLPGTYTIGFGSYVPANYTGPGALYLHHVSITDQDENDILNESFDGWSQTATVTENSVTRAEFETVSGQWNTYADTANFYTGLGGAFATMEVAGDNGMVYPMDGGGPFSVLIRTIISVPSGTTELRINVDWSYNMTIFSGGEPRLFSIGLKQGTVDPEYLFSFSTSARTGGEDENIEFNSTDFVDNTNTPYAKIRTTTLPDASIGTLLLDGQPISVGDEILSEEYDRLAFIPMENQSGETYFEYEPYANGSYQSAVTVELVVIAVNDDPVTAEDTATTEPNTSVTFNVLDNDTDVDGDSLFISQATAENGEVNINLDNTLTYLPSSNFEGLDTINYEVSDSQGGMATGNVNIQVKSRENVGEVQEDVKEENTTAEPSAYINGGSFSWWSLCLLYLIYIRQYRLNKKNTFI